MVTVKTNIDEYINWLKESYSYKNLDNSSGIMTPFRNHLNDYIRIYVDSAEDGKVIRLSDDGQT